MSVTANINNTGVATNSRFIGIENSYKDYVTHLRQQFKTTSDGSDHFISTFNDIDELVKIYDDNPENLPDVMRKIQETPNLCSWVSAVFCAIIYGFDEKNSLGIQKIKFKEYDSQTKTVKPVENMQYLEVWKEKFDLKEKSGSKVIKTNDEDKSYSVNGNPAPFEDGAYSINVISFANGKDGTKYPNMLGCFSSVYFVIPMKEFKLSKYKNDESWRKKYVELFDNRKDFTRNIQNLNVRQKILLSLSASSIPANAPEPIKLIQALINGNIDVSSYGVNIANLPKIPSVRTICNINFYKTSSVIDLDNLVRKNVCLGIDHGQNGNIYRATYPITDVLVKALESSESYVDNVVFRVNPDPEKANAVSSVEFSFDYHDKLLFLAADNVTETDVDNSIIYKYSIKKTYETSDITNIRKLQTMCMFPNLSSEFENRCKKFTYFCLEDSFILTTPVDGVKNPVDLSAGIFKGIADNDGKKHTIIKKDMSDDTHHQIKTPVGTVFTTASPKAEHFIDVCDENGSSYGYALNIRWKKQNIPALLTSPTNGGFEIKIAKPADVQQQRFDAYVDFGSSSSCMKYKIGTGSFLPSTVTESCTVRTFLSEYFKSDYKFVINDPEINNHTNFMSISTLYDETVSNNDYSLYKEGWMPVTKNLTGYEPTIKVDPSYKTDIVKTADVRSPNLIINNLCYTIACNAVANNCDEVFIVPSLPSKNYLNNLKNIWNYAQREVQTMFDIKIHNALEADDIQFLFESIAVSNGITGKAPNNLMVSVDMGDGTTDMSAVIIDVSGNIHPCGQASIEYAGKDLIKATISDILENMSKSEAEQMLKGDLKYASSLFQPFNKSNDGKAEYEGRVSNLINSYNAGRKNNSGEEEDRSWENKVMDVLAISNLHKGIDQKVAANFILRYMILMPVIKDFISTAIKLAGNRKINNVTIDFVGGSAKGIELLNVIDAHRTQKAGDILRDYFIDAFGKGTVVNGITPSAPSTPNGKDILIDGLKSLDVKYDPDTNSVSVYMGNIPKPEVKKQLDEEWKKIDPTEISDLGNSVHQNSLNSPFQGIVDEATSPKIYNKGLIEDPSSYYKDYDQKKNPGVPIEDFKDYFNNEIYGKLIDDGNGKPDTIETLIVNFVNKASETMEMAIEKEIIVGTNNSFYRATHSTIYPEMIKNTIFMFTVSKLLSDFHGGFRKDHTIQTIDDADGFQFGG